MATYIITDKTVSDYTSTEYNNKADVRKAIAELVAEGYKSEDFDVYVWNKGYIENPIAF